MNQWDAQLTFQRGPRMAWHDIQTSNWPTSGCWSICGLCSGLCGVKSPMARAMSPFRIKCISGYLNHTHSSWFWHLSYTCHEHINQNAELDAKTENKIENWLQTSQPNKKHRLLLGMDNQRIKDRKADPITSTFLAILARGGKPVKSDAKSEIPREKRSFTVLTTEALFGNLLWLYNVSVPRIGTSMNPHFYKSRLTLRGCTIT